ncbi:MAG TPA: hypothetical protein VMW19_00605 [Myxococcota bacterium]|nr:hypothetical protein [Myxococcota bacterium]
MGLRRTTVMLWTSLALAAPVALAAQPAADACAEQLSQLQKRLAFLQQRLANLEHELASRPSPQAAADAWRDPATWRALRNGMSQADVLRVLGPPGRVTVYYGFLRWEYPDALGARVDFDERGRLIAWGALAR